MNQRPPVAQRIVAARKRVGLSEKALAERLGITVPAYQDLESDDSEAFMCVSLSQLHELGSALRVPPRQLLAPEGLVPPEQTVSMGELVARVQAMMAAEGVTADQFGERVGWDVSSALADPASAWVEWNPDGLRDICAAVGVDWLAVLPDK